MVSSGVLSLSRGDCVTNGEVEVFCGGVGERTSAADAVAAAVVALGLAPLCLRCATEAAELP